MLKAQGLKLKENKQKKIYQKSQQPFKEKEPVQMKSGVYMQTFKIFNPDRNSVIGC